MSQLLTVRKAIPQDISAIQQIANGTWPDAYGKIISQEQISYMLDMMYSHDSLQEQMDQGHQFYIAEMNQKALGFASVSNEGDKGCKLNKLYVLPTIQKTGAGKALLQEVIQFTNANDQQRLFLQVNKENSAKHFYTKMGFTIADEIKLDIGNGFFMDDYIMEKIIPDF